MTLTITSSTRQPATSKSAGIVPRTPVFLRRTPGTAWPSHLGSPSVSHSDVPACWKEQLGRPASLGTLCPVHAPCTALLPHCSFTQICSCGTRRRGICSLGFDGCPARPAGARAGPDRVRCRERRCPRRVPAGPGREHRKFGAIAEYYPYVGASLVATLAHFNGPAWTPELATDWKAAYDPVAQVMISAAAEDAGIRPACWEVTGASPTNCACSTSPRSSGSPPPSRCTTCRASPSAWSHRSGRGSGASSRPRTCHAMT